MARNAAKKSFKDMTAAEKERRAEEIRMSNTQIRPANAVPMPTADQQAMHYMAQAARGGDSLARFNSTIASHYAQQQIETLNSHEDD